MIQPNNPYRYEYYDRVGLNKTTRALAKVLFQREMTHERAKELLAGVPRLVPLPSPPPPPPPATERQLSRLRGEIWRLISWRFGDASLSGAKKRASVPWQIACDVVKSDMTHVEARQAVRDYQNA